MRGPGLFNMRISRVKPVLRIGPESRAKVVCVQEGAGIGSWTLAPRLAKAWAIMGAGETEANGAPGSSDMPKAVAALKADYCQWLDGQQWDRWASLFTEDATMQVGPDADSAVRGRRAIRRLLKVQLRGAETLHQAQDPEIHQEGPGQVRVVWRMTDRVSTPLYLLEGAGFYEDRYVRTDDGWKIEALRLHRSKVDLQPKSFLMRVILRMHRNGWLRRLSKSADRTLGEALYVGLAEGERP
jgi:hypothetical protein